MKTGHGRRLALGLAFWAGLAGAEDIDLFVGGSSASREPPSVLLVLDNGANFSASAPVPAECADVVSAMDGTVGGIEQCALYRVVESLEADSVRLGVMLFNGNLDIPECEGSAGGCLAYPLTTLDAAGKAALLRWIRSWKTSGNGPGVNIKASANRNGAVMQEAWALFAGRTGLSGRSYAGLQPAAGCGNHYVIFVGNSFNSSGKPGEGGGGNLGPAAALRGSLGGAQAAMNASPAASAAQTALISGPVAVSCGSASAFTFPSGNHENGGYHADEWARYMRSQNIVTYTVGLLGSGCQPEYEALLRSMGSVGGGKYFPTTDYTQLKAALDTALSEIQSINSVFASVSLPVSVNTQGTYLNQVFIGMFRPDGNARPRWIGNLKQYRLGYLDGRLRLLDADGRSAISSGDSGFIAECARSEWTPPRAAADSHLYWADSSEANCLGFAPAAETPDGNRVEKGGQGYRLRALAPAERNLLTCDADCSATLAGFTPDNPAIGKAALGDARMSDSQRSALIDWVRGQNRDGEAIGGLSESQSAGRMRPSVHGDVVHSRPVALDYASAGSAPQVVVFYGGNDGQLRAVNGNREGGRSIAGKAPGEELWAFVAPESYGILARLRANEPLIDFPGLASATARPKDYGFDGPLTIWQDAGQAWLYAGMRRGGRRLYAFDVGNPALPRLKWRIGCPLQDSDEGCSSGLDGIGQTWALPTLLQVDGYRREGALRALLLVGGGYDRCEDADPPAAACKRSGKGHAIYLLDADSGALLQTFATEGGVVGDITLVRDAAGLAQYAYAADLGGNVYRIDGGSGPLGSVTPGEWQLTRLAALGGSGSQARKFLFGPDVLVDGDTHYLLLGSGDREKPLDSYGSAASVQNHFFMLRDRPADPAWLTGEQERCGAGHLCLDSLLRIDGDSPPEPASLAARKGWYLPLRGGEQVVTSALTIFGTVYFSTHRPLAASADSCRPDLGETRSYSIDYRNAGGLNGSRHARLTGDGLPPSPVAGMVTLDDGRTVPFCIGCDPRSPLEGSEPEAPASGTHPGSRVFWHLVR